jgi:hypothetical protein
MEFGCVNSSRALYGTVPVAHANLKESGNILKLNTQTSALRKSLKGDRFTSNPPWSSTEVAPLWERESGA